VRRRQIIQIYTNWLISLRTWKRCGVANRRSTVRIMNPPVNAAVYDCLSKRASNKSRRLEVLLPHSIID
jgi:hypothetical protein